MIRIPRAKAGRAPVWRRRRLAVAALMTVLTITAVFLGTLAVTSEAATVQGQPTADSYVRSDWNANFGTSTQLYARSSAPATTTFLRFDVPGVQGTVTNATLRVFAKTSTSFGLEVRSVLGPWNESTLKYSNAPPVGAVAARTGAYSAGEWVSIDVTPLVTTGAVDLALTTPSTGFLSVSSREVSADAPQLVLATQSPSPSPSPSPSSPSPTAVSQGDATADSYVRSDWNANFGTSTQLSARSTAPATTAYLRFNLPGVQGTVTNATLKLYTKASTSFGVQIRPVLGAWDESTLKYSNAPAVGPPAATTGAFSTGQWVLIDVTSMVSTGAVDLALTTPSTGFVSVSSREVTAEAPKLEVRTKATYYVDAAAGNDANPGTTPAAAWRTLTKVKDAVLAPGDTVLFNRGNQWSGTLNLQRSGTGTGRIVIGSYGAGPLPIIQSGQSCVYVFGSFVTIKELQTQNCAWGGIDIHGSDNRVEANVIVNNAAGVVINTGAMRNVIVNNEIRDNNRMSTLTQTPTNDDSGAFGVVVAGDDNEVAYNKISGSYAMSFDYGQDGAALEVYGGQRNFFHHNVTSQNDTFAELGDSRAADNTFAYNTFISTLTKSFFLVTRGPQDTFGPVLRTLMHNNTVYLTGAESQGVVCYAGCSTDLLTVRNNIIRAAGKTGYADGPFIQTNNLFSGSLFQGNILGLLEPIVIILDPGFVNAAVGDLHLNPLSQAIDRGAELGYRQDLDKLPVPVDGNSDGSALPDIGAFEFRP
ncbi:MAG: DNRLRE domain-containing protein [Actinomycetota bacterium]